MVRLRRFSVPTLALFLVFSTLTPSSTALVRTPDPTAPYPKAISDLKEALVKVLGFQGDDFKVSGFDLRDALVGNSVAYEFEVETDNKVRPFRLLEDVNRWDYVDLPVFQAKESVRAGEDKGLVQKKGFDKGPVLAPFQLAGPMELWIQDADDMRLSLPHDVDAGVLRKVVLADGAVVTVSGARSVSLRQPLDLRLPLNTSDTGFASGLLVLSEQLRHASRAPGAPLPSLRIVGPTSLTAPASASMSSSNRLKLKRLAPGLVELSSMPKNNATDALSAVDVATLIPKQFTTLWPLASINGSNANLVGFEQLLTAVLGDKATREGSFKLLKANVSAQTFIKIGFGVERMLKEGDGISWEHFPSWRTKPETARMHFEVLAKVDGEKVIPERVMQVEPVLVADSLAPNMLLGNITMSRLPIVHPPPKFFTL